MRFGPCRSVRCVLTAMNCWGARLGSTAAGKLAQRPLMSSANAPPRIRLASPCETVPFLASSDQVVLPAVAASGAQLGRSVHTYQSGEVAFEMRGADSHVLWRVVAQRSRAHGQTGNKTLVTQCAKVGCCPCCSSVAHVAAPGSYALGAHYAQKDVVMQLRQAFSHWGPRRSRRMGISRKIGTGRHRPSMSTAFPFRSLFRRRWVVFAI